jgi:hypothetical protein
VISVPIGYAMGGRHKNRGFIPGLCILLRVSYVCVAIMFCLIGIFSCIGFLFRFLLLVCALGRPLWSSGQSSWLEIRKPGFDSRHYQKKSCGSGTGSTQPREYN